jgi:hypothetical protein
VGDRSSRRATDRANRSIARFNRMTIGIVATAAIALIALTFSSAALAAPGYQDEFEFGSESLNLSPSDIAVAGNGDVLVANRATPFDSANSFIAVFEPGPTGATQVAEIGGFERNAPYGIAVDQANEDLYVSDPVANTITRYLSNGANPPAYTLDGTYPSPEVGSAPGQIGSFEAALAIDPTTGDLLVADPGNRRIDRYGPNGTFISSFDGTAGPLGEFTLPRDLVVQPNGDIDVLNLAAPPGFFGNVEGASTVERFEADGTPIEALDPSLTPEGVSIGFDPERGNILVGRQFGLHEPEGRQPILNVIHNGTLVQEASYRFIQSFNSFSAAAPALAAAGGRVYGLTQSSATVIGGGSGSVQTFETVTFPDVFLGQPTKVTATSVHLEGTVNPDGKETTYRFELSTDGGTTWDVAAEGAAGSGSEAKRVQADITGLAPLTAYQARLTAENATAKSFSGVNSFETGLAPPLAVTLDASELTTESALVSGSVDPQGVPATYFFEYGPTQAYGYRLPLEGSEAAGNSREARVFSTRLSGLQANAEYHYRIVASGPGGSAAGEDRVFRTGATAPPVRAYELVSPLEKGNAYVNSASESDVAGEDGESIAFGTTGLAYPGSPSAPKVPVYLARRSSGGWNTESIDPPQTASRIYGAWHGAIAISKDQSRALVVSPENLTAGASGNKPKLYVYEIATGRFQSIAELEPEYENYSPFENVLGWSADMSTVAFETSEPLVPGTTGRNLYVWREGLGVELVRAPDGRPFEENAVQVGLFSHAETRAVSEDGRRIYFSTIGGAGAGLYLSEVGEPTKLISFSRRPSDPRNAVPATLLNASPDGRVAVFNERTGEAHPLTEDAPEAEPGQMYQFDADTGQLTYLASKTEEEKVLVDPLTGAALILNFGSNLVGNNVRYVDGATSVPVTKEEGATAEMQVSPNHRYYVFAAVGNQTGYDSAGNREIYRFDAVHDKLVCVSCRGAGLPATGNASLNQFNQQAGFSHHYARSVLDDGTVFFDTPDPLVSSDTNGVRDVYAYENGQQRLVSGGREAAAATFADATPDGANVFFVTGQSLVAADHDGVPDLYDARVGGGFAGAAPPAAPCDGEGCRNATGEPSAAGTTGSELSAPQVKRPVHQKPKCSKAKGKRKRGKGAKASRKRACAKPKPKPKKKHVRKPSNRRGADR